VSQAYRLTPTAEANIEEIGAFITVLQGARDVGHLLKNL
jgi:hypothetical protein